MMGLTVLTVVKGVMAAVMRLLGADSPEQVDEYDYERLSGYIEKPLRINQATRSRIIASGLFTQYQTASLLDYIDGHGDVLSFAELSAVEGFSPEKVRALEPFISLESDSDLPGTSGAGAGVETDLILRTNLKHTQPENDYAYGLKWRFTLADRLQLGLSANRGYGGDGFRPDGGAFYLALYGKRRLGKLVLGDFNLRYGQGLGLWSGFVMDALSAPESFWRRPSGISPYWSYTGAGSHRGVAVDFSLGKFVVSASLSAMGLRELMFGRKDVELSLMPAVNVAWYGRNAQVSLTGYAQTTALTGGLESGGGTLGARVLEEGSEGLETVGPGIEAGGCSADFRWCISGMDLFGEVALDAMKLKTTAVAGVAFGAGENLSLVARAARLQDRYSLAAGGRFFAGEKVSLAGQTGFGSTVSRHTGTFSAEALYFPEPKYGSLGPGVQVKLMLNYSLQLLPEFCVAFRLSERIRNGSEKSRTDLRMDLKWADGSWRSTMRLNALYNTDLALLGYLEGGWVPDWASFYARVGVFRIDNWADRIYVYERDAPGNFNVPAYYGRGCWAAVTMGLKLWRRLKLYLRLSTTQYPWVSPTASERIGRSECRVMLNLRL